MTENMRLTPAQDHGPMRTIAWLQAPGLQLNLQNDVPTLIIRSGSTDLELRFPHGVASLMDFQRRVAALDVQEHFPDHFKGEEGEETMGETERHCEGTSFKLKVWPMVRDGKAAQETPRLMASCTQCPVSAVVEQPENTGEMTTHDVWDGMLRRLCHWMDRHGENAAGEAYAALGNDRAEECMVELMVGHSLDGGPVHLDSPADGSGYYFDDMPCSGTSEQYGHIVTLPLSLGH